MKGTDWKDPIELSKHQPISYKWIDETPGGMNLGRAEFTFCPKYKRDRLTEMFISRKQQREKDRYYIAKGLNSESFSFRKQDDIRATPIWRIAFCHDHKVTRFELYVPMGTSTLLMDYSSIMTEFVFG